MGRVLVLNLEGDLGGRKIGEAEGLELTISHIVAILTGRLSAMRKT